MFVEAEQKQPVFNLCTNHLFLMTWKGGEIDKASESFRTKSHLWYKPRAGNSERRLVSLNVEIHDLNGLVNDTNEEKDLENLKWNVPNLTVAGPRL